MQEAPFRAAYGKIGNLRGFVHCPVLCLTATAGKKTARGLLKALYMRDVMLVKVTPDKSNSKFNVRKTSGDIEVDFQWVLDELKGKMSECSRIIIYCKTISSCGELYSMFVQELDDTFCGMFAMYHSKTPDDIQKIVLESLIDPHGKIRVVFATSALGMGVNLPNVRHIIHYGIPHDVEDYLQEVGRGGRDGGMFTATVIYRSYDLANCDPAMRKFVQNPNNECRRNILMEYFNEKVVNLANPMECCDICDASSGIIMQDASATGVLSSPSNKLIRFVDEEDQKLLREVLLDNVCSNTGMASVLGIGGLVNAVDIDIVEQLVEQSNHVFSAKYLLENFPILSVKLAQTILTIFNEVFGDISEAELSQELIKDFEIDPLMVSVPNWCNLFDHDDSSDDELLDCSLNTLQ